MDEFAGRAGILHQRHRVLLGDLKRGYHGTYHHMSVKHLQVAAVSMPQPIPVNPYLGS